MADLPPPVRVSPVIKFCRYSLLVAGILYGAARKEALKIKEESRKEEREALRARRETEAIEAKRRALERDVAELVSIFIPREEATDADADSKPLDLCPK